MAGEPRRNRRIRPPSALLAALVWLAAIALWIFAIVELASG